MGWDGWGRKDHNHHPTPNVSLHPLPQTTSTAVGQAQFILLRVNRRAVGEPPRFETEAPFHALMWLVGLARATSGPHGQGKLVAHRHVARLIDRKRVCARAGILGQMLAFIIFITNFPPSFPSPTSLITGTTTRKSCSVRAFVFIVHKLMSASDCVLPYSPTLPHS